MSTATISLQVDADLARIFTSAPIDERRRWEMLLGLRLKELIAMPQRPLLEIMDEIGRQAQARGLTEEILESILQDE